MAGRPEAKIGGNIENSFLLDDINKMLKEKKLLNRIDGIRLNNGKWEWALKNCDDKLEWFSIHQACTHIENYVLAFEKFN